MPELLGLENKCLSRPEMDFGWLSLCFGARLPFKLIGSHCSWGAQVGEQRCLTVDVLNSEG